MKSKQRTRRESMEVLALDVALLIFLTFLTTGVRQVFMEMYEGIEIYGGRDYTVPFLVAFSPAYFLIFAFVGFALVFKEAHCEDATRTFWINLICGVVGILFSILFAISLFQPIFKMHGLVM